MRNARSELPCATIEDGAAANPFVLQVLGDDVAKVGRDASHDILQALAARNERLVHVAISGVVHAGSRVVEGHEGRGYVEGATPEVHLLGPELLGGLLLVLTGQVAVVALVEAPAPSHAEPGPVGRVQGYLGRANRARQDRRVQDAQVEVALGRQELAGHSGLRLALGGEVDVLPPGKEVEVVPLGASVA